MRIIGLDLSLTRTGISVHEDGEHQCTFSVVTKATESPMARTDKIYQQVLNQIDPENDTRVFIEDMIKGKMAKSGSTIERAGLFGLIQYTLWSQAIECSLVPPGTLKKYMTGHGTGEKSVILHEVAKKTGFEAKNDDEADAYTLADFGYNLLFPDEPQRKLFDYELKVLKKYKKENGI